MDTVTVIQDGRALIFSATNDGLTQIGEIEVGNITPARAAALALSIMNVLGTRTAVRSEVRSEVGGIYPRTPRRQRKQTPRAETVARVKAVIDRTPGVTANAIAKELGVTHSWIRLIVRDMAMDGLVRIEREADKPTAANHYHPITEPLPWPPETEQAI